MLGAPVIEGKEPVADLALAWGGAGHPGPQVQRVAELFLADPGGGDLLPVPVTVQGVQDLSELRAGQVLQVADEQALDAVFGVAGAAAAPVPGADHPAARRRRP